MTFQKALITGATSGIGEALARFLAAKNISLILLGRNQNKLRELEREIKGAKTVVSDLSKENDRRQVIATIREELPDLVVNNAGLGIYGDVLSTSLDEQKNIVEVDVLAVLELSIETARALIKAGKKGVILNVSSVAGEYPTPGMTAYGASKAFVTSFSNAFHDEVASKGIDVLVACPGMVATDFSNRAARKKVTPKNAAMTPEFAAKEIWKQIQNRKEKHIFSTSYRIALWIASRFVPTTFIKKIVHKRIKERL